MTASGALRSTVLATDPARVRAIVAATGFFHPSEVDVAVELAAEALAKGPASGYHFLFAEEPARAAEPARAPENANAAEHGALLGYACFGPIPCTAASYDLYWIVVAPSAQGQGWGRRLVREAERAMAALGARRVFVDTSGRAQYAPTRAFYERCGYQVAGRLANFYDEGDDKVVYHRELPPAVPVT